MSSVTTNENKDEETTNQQQNKMQEVELSLFQLKNEGDNAFKKASEKFNFLIQEVETYEAKIKELEAANKEEEIIFRQKCVPELLKLSEIKLAFLLKAEKIIASHHNSPKAILIFCDFVQIFASDVMFINEKVNEFVEKYKNIAQNRTQKKNKINENKEFFREEEIGENFADDDSYDFNNEDTFHKKSKTKEQQKIDFTKVSLNDLYKSIAKELHPDLEKEDNVRDIKMKLMQELSEAKNENNLLAMLKIQHKASEYLSKNNHQNIFNVDKLKQFNKILQDKIKKYKEIIQNNLLKSYYKDANGYLQINTAISLQKRIDKDIKQIKKITKAIKYDFHQINDFYDLNDFMIYYTSN